MPCVAGLLGQTSTGIVSKLGAYKLLKGISMGDKDTNLFGLHFISINDHELTKVLVG